MHHSFVIFQLPHINDLIIVGLVIKLHEDVNEGQYTHFLKIIEYFILFFLHCNLCFKNALLVYIDISLMVISQVTYLYICFIIYIFKINYIYVFLIEVRCIFLCILR